MNTLSTSATITMTSLELVDYINSQRGEGESELRHDHFMAKVPKVLGDEHAPKFRDMITVTVGNGATRQSPIYRFPKREACLMAMSYSYDLQAKVFDRMTALEEQAAKPALNPANFSRLQLIELAMQAEQERLAIEKEKLVLEHQVEVLEPKANALDRIADADGTMNPTVAAKNLQVPPKRLFDWMREHHWIYRRPGGSGNVAYQDKIQAGYLTHKVTTVQREDGTEKVVEQVLVTGKGLAKLSQALGMH